MHSILARARGGSRPSGRRRAAARLPLIALLALVLTQAAGPVLTAGAAAEDDGGVHTLTGSVTITNPNVLDSRTDPYVLLRDFAELLALPGAIPPGQQILAGLEGDVADEATYTLSLPIAPKGAMLDLWSDEDGAGVQVYVVQAVSDAVGDPFFGPLDMAGVTPASSISIDFESFVWTGRFVVWAPDDEQAFPAGPGKDGELFTRDDPVASLDAGWTVVVLDGDEYAFERDGTVEVPLLEAETGYTDLSDLDYVDAFDALVEDLRVRYAFKDHKDIDFDAIVEEIRPLVVEAERDEDPEAYAIAMLRFAAMFGDGHVKVDVKNELFDDYLTDRYGGGLGLKLGETDDGEIVVAAVEAGSPAEEAGIEPGAEILEWDGDPIDEALEDVELIRGASSPQTLRDQQLRLLPRLPEGEEVEVELRNPGERSRETVELEAVADPDGLATIRGIRNPNKETLPVTFAVLPSGIGYVKVNTFHDEVSLIYDAWELALTRLDELGVPALIVDVRGNGGGLGVISEHFAGAFVDEPFVLANDFAADGDGKMRRAGATMIEPSAVRWDKPVAVLVDAGCGSACEIFSAAMAEAGHPIVGHTPTAGVEAGIEPWTLPEDLYFQASIYLLLDDEGEVFLEGVGVPPTIDVPVTAESLVSAEDEVLIAAEETLFEEVDDR